MQSTLPCLLSLVAHWAAIDDRFVTFELHGPVLLLLLLLLLGGYGSSRAASIVATDAEVAAAKSGTESRIAPTVNTISSTFSQKIDPRSSAPFVPCICDP